MNEQNISSRIPATLGFARSSREHAPETGARPRAFRGGMLVAIGLLALAPLAAAQSAPAARILLIDVGNLVNYNHDTFDIQKNATSTGIAPNVRQPAFIDGMGIADVVAVNDQPAKGLAVYKYEKFDGVPAQTAGKAIADVTRLSWITLSIEIQDMSGTSLGTIMAQGFAQGTPPPGSPAAQTVANWTIMGGTGIFVGVRGTAGNAAPPGQAAQNPRQASIVEDPAFRRVNGGGKSRFIFNILDETVPLTRNRDN